MIGRTSVHVDGVPEAQRVLAQFGGQKLQNKLRKAVRAGAKPFQGTLKSAAASADVPRSFQKVLAPKTTTHGGASGREVEAYVRPKSPLFNIDEVGAGPHTIAPHAGRLAGPAGGSAWDATGRKRGRGFFSRSAVRHPGLAARPILPAAFGAGQARATDAIANAIFQIGRGEL